MKIKATITTTLLLLILPAGIGQAAPPKPLPNPDRAFVTPRVGAEDGAGISANGACNAMRRYARYGNRISGLRVRNLKSGKTICGLNSKSPRILASNTKIFTTAATLGRLGPDHRYVTRVFASGEITPAGVLKGNLFLKGGGDPSFFQRRALDVYSGGTGTRIENLANRVKASGIKRITGRVIGDDSVFDRLTGVADSGFATSPYIGPLSGLDINAGYTSSSFSRFSSNPARLATTIMARELRQRGIKVRPEIALKKTPRRLLRGALIARQFSPDMAWMARMTNKDSNNFFAEMLLKNLGANLRNSGTTSQGTIVSERYARKLGSRIRQVDGSGLTSSNRASPANVVRMLARVRQQSYGKDFVRSLPIAGVDGTLGSRMGGSSAERRCHAKTGTLTGASALSGYCFNKNGHRFAFSILMNGVYDLNAAHRGQDRIAALIARL